MKMNNNIAVSEMVTITPLSVKIKINIGNLTKIVDVTLTNNNTNKRNQQNRPTKKRNRFTNKEKINILSWKKSNKLVNKYPTNRSVSSIYSIISRMRKTGEDKKLLDIINNTNKQNQRFTDKEKIDILLWKKSNKLNKYLTNRSISSIYSIISRMRKTGEDKKLLNTINTK